MKYLLVEWHDSHLHSPLFNFLEQISICPKMIYAFYLILLAVFAVLFAKALPLDPYTIAPDGKKVPVPKCDLSKCKFETTGHSYYNSEKIIVSNMTEVGDIRE